MEQPPEEACYTKVTELNPFVCQVSRVNAEVAKNEGWDDHGSKEAYIECVDRVVNVGFILLKESISKGPAHNAKHAIDIGSQVVIREIKVVDEGALGHEVLFSAE